MERYGKQKFLALLLAVLCLVNTGCQSIMINADLSKATAEDRQTALDRMVEENKKNMEQGQSDLETAVNVQKSEDDYKKYDIGGTEAFYLLPTGTPLPETLLDFKVLDLINGTTTVYAYQALYNKSDSSGLGGKGLTGKREKYEDVAEVAMKDIKNLVTVLMSYDTKNQTYKVFYHSITPCTAAYVKNGEDSAERLSVTLKKDVEEGKFASSNDFYNIFTQKVNDNCYLIFENCVGRFYDRNGNLLETYDLNENLNELTYTGKKDIEYSYNISKVVCDKNRYMYTLINAENKNIKLDDDMSEADLEKDSGSDMYQMLMCNFQLSLGLHDSEVTAEDGTTSTVKKGYFISPNTSFDQQIIVWMSDDKRIIDLGSDNSLDPDDEDELRKKAKQRAIDYAEATKGSRANHFGTYYYDEDSMNTYLYESTKSKKNSRKEVNPGNFREVYNHQKKRNYYAYFPTKVSASANKLNEYLLIPGGQLTDQELIRESRTKTVTLKWTRVEDSVDEDGNPTQTETEYTADVELSENFDKYYRTHFQDNTVAQMINWRKTSNDIAPCNDNGVIRYGTEGSGDAETSFMKWESAKGQLISTLSSKTSGKARNLYMYQTGLTARMVMTGDKNLLVTTGRGGQWTSSEISNRDLSFGFEVDATGMEMLNRMKMSDLTTEGSAKTADTQLTVNEDDAVDNYLDIGICFGKMNMNTLYLAGPTSGLVCYQIGNTRKVGTDASGKDIYTAFQISAYPYYGVWMDDPFDGMDVSCKVIGYQTKEYAYDMKDLFRAKLYSVGLEDDAANANKFLSVLEKYPVLQSRLMSSTDAWTQLMAGIGIDSSWNTSGRADTATIRKYYDYLIKDEKDRKQAVDLFLTMAHCSSDTKKAFSAKSEFIEELKNCYYPADLEALMVKYIDKLYPEAAKNITLSDYEILPGADKAVENADSETKKLTEEAQKQLKEQQEEQRKQKQEFERDRKIIENIKEAGGYLADDTKKAKWDSELNEILSLLHGEFDTQNTDTQNTKAQS